MKETSETKTQNGINIKIRSKIQKINVKRIRAKTVEQFLKNNCKIF